MILYTLNKSPFMHQTLQSCLRLATHEDSILLIEDGVYAALATSQCVALLKSTEATILALGPDVEARGLSEKLQPAIKAVDYAGFVNLTATHDKVISWF